MTAERSTVQPGDAAAAFPAGVLVVGTGLVGTSVGLALRRVGADVRLRDATPALAREAVSLGAGRLATADDPPASLAVAAVPPEAVGEVVGEILNSGAAEYVTDVASVKALPAARVGEHATDPGRYVGSHPMAGREVSGPAAALPDLFEGRPWVLCPDDGTHQQAVTRALALARMVGAAPITMTADDHDAAVALVSHSPHVVAALVAARFTAVAEQQVRLAGPGVADVTRVAGGDPELWTEILTANAGAVSAVLRGLRGDLDRVLEALETSADDRRNLRDVLRSGVDGRARLPGKHGTAHTEFATLVVVVDDRPGQLAALFADVGTAEVNVEDVRIDHSPGQPVGLVELDVRPGAEDQLGDVLRGRGWTIRG
ncbi:prephenate dehydrogenase [Haloactinopolyspora alba]|uniref:Prephenate dehydrogenase n=1 Tax=Haloactinopolyspora alba TaxID=648780 RepID=A0A2P8E2B6_9ACTN|nr:prephenate dehydrogenase [Haloactinopolyspora alba]PSL03547.1 prephenate dehydrogenase [Haloactinopolyspora alba]